MTTTNRTLTPDRRALAASWWPYAMAAVRKARRRFDGIPIEDLVSAAIDGLMIAAAEFDPARGVPFGAYLALVVRSRIHATVRRWNGRREVLHLSSVEDDDGALWDPADYRTPDPARQALAYELVDRICRHLSERDAEVLWRVHAEERTLTELGERFGISRQAAKLIENRAMRRARAVVGAAAG